MINYLNIIIISAVSTSVMVMVLFVFFVLVALVSHVLKCMALKKRKKGLEVVR